MCGQVVDLFGNDLFREGTSWPPEGTFSPVRNCRYFDWVPSSIKQFTSRINLVRVNGLSLHVFVNDSSPSISGIDLVDDFPPLDGFIGARNAHSPSVYDSDRHLHPPSIELVLILFYLLTSSLCSCYRFRCHNV